MLCSTRMPSLRIMFDRFEGDKALFVTQEGQQLVWHKDDLPEDLREGNTYYVHFADGTDKKSITPTKTHTPIKRKKETKEDREQRKMARAILEEILNGSKEPAKPK